MNVFLALYSWHNAKMKTRGFLGQRITGLSWFMLSLLHYILVPLNYKGYITLYFHYAISIIAGPHLLAMCAVSNLSSVTHHDDAPSSILQGGVVLEVKRPIENFGFLGKSLNI